MHGFASNIERSEMRTTRFASSAHAKYTDNTQSAIISDITSLKSHLSDASFAACIAHSHSNVEFTHHTTLHHCMHGFASNIERSEMRTQSLLLMHRTYAMKSSDSDDAARIAKQIDRQP